MARRIVCLFPVEPLLEVLGATYDHPIAILSMRLGVHRRTIYKMMEAGGVDVWMADRLAVAARLSAEKVWPGWEMTADHEADVATQLDFGDLLAELTAVAS